MCASRDSSGSEQVGRTRRRLPDTCGLPDILLAEHLADAFGISTSQARQNLAAGVYGPRFKIGKRYWILRSVLLAHLESLSTLPEDRATGSPTGTKTIELITRQRRVDSLKPHEPNPKERRPR